MKKLIYLGGIAIFLIVSFTLIVIFNKNTDPCLKTEIKTNYKNGKVYTYCIRSYDENNIDFNTKINQLSNQSSYKLTEYNDGGSKLYKGQNYSYLICNTTEGNKDIYIGSKSLEYKEGFCK